jgi:hypothetical protein
LFGYYFLPTLVVLLASTFYFSSQSWRPQLKIEYPPRQTAGRITTKRLWSGQYQPLLCKSLTRSASLHKMISKAENRKNLHYFRTYIPCHGRHLILYGKPQILLLCKMFMSNETKQQQHIHELYSCDKRMKIGSFSLAKRHVPCFLVGINLEKFTYSGNGPRSPMQKW